MSGVPSPQKQVEEARAANFRWLATLAGGATVLAELVGGSRGWFASAMRGTTAVGATMARNIEAKLKLDSLWMDQAGRSHADVVAEAGDRLSKLLRSRRKRRQQQGGTK